MLNTEGKKALEAARTLKEYCFCRIHCGGCAFADICKEVMGNPEDWEIPEEVEVEK